jgi:hypothetical protein
MSQRLLPEKCLFCTFIAVDDSGRVFLLVGAIIPRGRLALLGVFRPACERMHRRSSMNQKLLLRRDELARTHELGTLRAQYPSRFILLFGGWKGLGCLGALSMCLLLFTSGIAAGNGAPLWLTLLVLATVFGGCLLCLLPFAIQYLFSHKEVYLYEHGFLCLRGHRIQATRWEQISEVRHLVAKGGALVALMVNLHDHTRIRVPKSVERFEELQQASERGAKPWSRPPSREM